MYRLAFLALLSLAACEKDPDKRTTAAESQVSARAVADVDAATKETLSAPSRGEATRAP